MRNKQFAPRRREGGMTLIVVLATLTFLTVMMTAALRSNLVQRRHVRRMRDRARATMLAESGVEEAVHAIFAGSGKGACKRVVGSGRYEAQWNVDASETASYWIVSRGFAKRDDPRRNARTLRVRAEVGRSTEDGKPAVRIAGRAWE